MRKLLILVAIMVLPHILFGVTAVDYFVDIWIKDDNGNGNLYVEKDVTLGVSETRDGKIVFKSATSSYTTTLVSGSPTANITFTLPSDTGDEGAVLTTDGNGNLSWTLLDSESVWQRTGTTISPKNNGDNLDMGTGQVKAATIRTDKIYASDGTLIMEFR